MIGAKSGRYQELWKKITMRSDPLGFVASGIYEPFQKTATPGISSTPSKVARIVTRPVEGRAR